MVFQIVHRDCRNHNRRFLRSLGFALVNKEIPVVADDYAEMEFGTGCVKMTPAHDPNDFEVGLRHGLEVLRVINDDGTIKTVYDLTKTKAVLPLSAILMAGGKGERLRPLTLNTPKPLLEIGGKAIIDYNIEALASVGIDDIAVTTRYLADQIHAHFSTPVAGVNVKCVTETIPLGTIGAASLVSRSEEGNTLVMNSDLLTTISFEEMYMRHIEEQADVTIAAIPYVVSVPYAILTTDGAQVKGIEEKPSYSYYANAGIYIFSNKLLNTVPSDSRTDATDLIEKKEINRDKDN